MHACFCSYEFSSMGSGLGFQDFGAWIFKVPEISLGLKPWIFRVSGLILGARALDRQGFGENSKGSGVGFRGFMTLLWAWALDF